MSSPDVETSGAMDNINIKLEAHDGSLWEADLRALLFQTMPEFLAYGMVSLRKLRLCLQLRTGRDLSSWKAWIKATAQEAAATVAPAVAKGRGRSLFTVLCDLTFRSEWRNVVPLKSFSSPVGSWALSCCIPSLTWRGKVRRTTGGACCAPRTAEGLAWVACLRLSCWAFWWLWLGFSAGFT